MCPVFRATATLLAISEMYVFGKFFFEIFIPTITVYKYDASDPYYKSMQLFKLRINSLTCNKPFIVLNPVPLWPIGVSWILAKMQGWYVIRQPHLSLGEVDADTRFQLFSAIR